MPTAEKRKWREKRGDGWGETIYSGLYIKFEPIIAFDSMALLPVLVSKLSHGLRVIQIKDEYRYQFESVPGREVSVSAIFVDQVRDALSADLNFQNWATPEFDKTMSE